MSVCVSNPYLTNYNNKIEKVSPCLTQSSLSPIQMSTLEDARKPSRHRRANIGQSNRQDLIGNFRPESIIDLVPPLIVPGRNAKLSSYDTKPNSFPLNTTDDRIYNTPCLQGDPTMWQRLAKNANQTVQQPSPRGLKSKLERLFPVQDTREFLNVVPLKEKAVPLKMEDVLGFQGSGTGADAGADGRKISLLQARKMEIEMINARNSAGGRHAGSLAISEPLSSCRANDASKKQLD